jgi:hypothetical protein
MKVNNFTNEMGDVVQGPSGLTSYTTAVAVVAASLATPAIVLGTAAAAGAAATTIRSDSTIVAFDATSPTTSAVGDAVATGSVALAARRDHRHGREGFGSPVDIGTGNADGSAVTVSRSDHVHMGALPEFDHTHIVGEAMLGNGSTTVFYLANEASEDQEPAVYVNGLRTDVTLSGMYDAITFAVAPPAASSIRLDYVPALA